MADEILLESGGTDFLLLEDGDAVLLESSGAVGSSVLTTSAPVSVGLGGRLRGVQLIPGNLLTLARQDFEVAHGYTAGPSCSVAQDLTDSFTGITSLRVTRNTTTGDAVATVPQINPILPNTRYTFSLRAKATGGVARSCYIYCEQYDAAGAFVSGSALASSAANDSTTAWTTYSVTFVSKPTAQRLVCQFYATSVLAGEFHNIDYVSVRTLSAIPVPGVSQVGVGAGLGVVAVARARRAASLRVSSASVAALRNATIGAAGPSVLRVGSALAIALSVRASKGASGKAKPSVVAGVRSKDTKAASLRVRGGVAGSGRQRPVKGAVSRLRAGVVAGVRDRGVKASRVRVSSASVSSVRLRSTGLVVSAFLLRAGLGVSLRVRAVKGVAIKPRLSVAGSLRTRGVKTSSPRVRAAVVSALRTRGVKSVPIRPRGPVVVGVRARGVKASKVKASPRVALVVRDSSTPSKAGRVRAAVVSNLAGAILRVVVATGDYVPARAVLGTGTFRASESRYKAVESGSGRFTENGFLKGVE